MVSTVLLALTQTATASMCDSTPAVRMRRCADVSRAIMARHTLRLVFGGGSVAGGGGSVVGGGGFGGTDGAINTTWIPRVKKPTMINHRSNQMGGSS